MVLYMVKIIIAISISIRKKVIKQSNQSQLAKQSELFSVYMPLYYVHHL